MVSIIICNGMFFVITNIVFRCFITLYYFDSISVYAILSYLYKKVLVGNACICCITSYSMKLPYIAIQLH